MTLILYGAGSFYISAFIIGIGGYAVVNAAGQGDVGKIGIIRIATPVPVSPQGDDAGIEGLLVNSEGYGAGCCDGSGVAGIAIILEPGGNGFAALVGYVDRC